MTCIKQLNFPKVYILYTSMERLWFGHKKALKPLSLNELHLLLFCRKVTALYRGHIQILSWVSPSPIATVLYGAKCVTFIGIILKQQTVQRKRLLSSILEIIVQEPNDTNLHPKTLSIIQNLRHIIKVNKSHMTWIYQVIM